MRTTTFTLILFLLLAPLSTHAVQHDPGFASRLPSNTSLYVTTERLGEVVQAIVSSNFYKRFYEVPAIQEAVQAGEFPDLTAKWDTMMASEQGAMMRPFLSLLEDEVIIATTADGSRGLIPGLVQLVRIGLLSQEYQRGGEAQVVLQRLEAAAADLENKMGLEPFVLAFRAEQKETIEPMLAAMLAQLPPEIGQMMTTEEINGIPYTTASVSPVNFLPHESLQAPLSMAIPDSGVIKTILSAYAGLTLKARLGWIDNYLVLVLEDEIGTLATQLAEGPGKHSLADMKELGAILDQIGEKPFRRVVFNMNEYHDTMQVQLEDFAEDFKRCPTIMGFVAMAGFTAETLGEKLLEASDKMCDPRTAVAAAELLDGIRFVADLFWAPTSQYAQVGSMKLSMREMIPASAIGWCIQGTPDGTELWKAGLDEQIELRRMPLWTLATMAQPPEQKALQQKITDMMVIARDHLSEAFGNEGLAVMSWQGELKTIRDEQLDIKIPEFATVVEITDREKIKEVGGLFAAKIGELLSQKADTIVEFPSPTTTKVKDGERFTWEGLIPAEGNGLLPTIYLTKKHLVISSSARLAEEVYETCRHKGKTREWPKGEAQELVGSKTYQAGVFLISEVIDSAGPMIMKLIERKGAEADDQAKVETVRANLPPILDLAKVLDHVWFHFLNEDGKGHITAHISIKDLP